MIDSKIEIINKRILSLKLTDNFIINKIHGINDDIMLLIFDIKNITSLSDKLKYNKNKNIT